MTDSRENTFKEPDHSFGKEFKLCSRKKIAELFNSGNTTKNFPLKALWQIVDSTKDNTDVPLQIAFSVPKKSFKRANERNRIKRLMREGFRLNKCLLEHYLNDNHKRMYVFIIYQERKELSFEIIEKKMIKMIHQLIKTQENEAV